ncbi:MAG: IS1/IS6 family transposase [Nitrososphaerota archaeon]|nr:IS1/IS6 family transposase [Nitrososphaerota archaeon]
MTRGEQIAKEKTILENGDGSFSVPSQTVEEIAYLVRLIDGKYLCNCLDFKHRHEEVGICKHIHAVKFWIASQVEIEQKPKPKVFSDDSIQCEKCGSIRVWKFGHDAEKQIYKCKDCKHKFRYSLLKKAKYSPETVSLCLDLYFSGTSLAKTARILNNQFDMRLGKITIYRWIQKFVPKISEYVNSLAPTNLSEMWHVDEVFQHMKGGNLGKNNKRIAYLWQVMDRKTRFMLASQLSKFRDDYGAAQAFSTALQNAHGFRPEKVFTDSAKAYKQSVTRIFGKGVHVANCGLGKLPNKNNNRIERANGTTRERLKVQRGWKSMETQIPEGFRIHYNFVKPHEALEGMTPAQRAGIGLYSKNKWLELLEQAMIKVGNGYSFPISRIQR